MTKIAKFVLLSLCGPMLIWAQISPRVALPTQTPAGVPVKMLVTIGHHYGQTPPVLTKDDLLVTERVDPVPVTQLIPLRDEHAGLDLFLLVDNYSNCEPGSKFEELSRFILSQPATTAVGVAYIQNGQLRIAQNPTADHKRAVEALSTPEGSKPATPFVPLAQLIRTWPQGANRRAVLMISNGINPAADGKPQDQSAEDALEAAQRAGISLYVIYHPSADYLKTDSTKLYNGQVELAHVADETGGEAYFLGFGPLPSLAPFLADLSDHLANQYLLEFLATPAEGAGEMRRITVRTKIPGLEVMTANQVWIPGRNGVKRHATETESPEGERP